MKKPGIAALAVVLAALACLPATAEKTKVTFMGWGAEGRYHELFDATFKAYPELAQKYEINYVMTPGSTEAFSKLRLQLAAGDGLPDMMEMGYSSMSEFVGAGIFADLTKAIEPYKANILPEMLQLANFGGKLYGIPIQVNTRIWFYRKDLFNAAGIDPTKVKNTDDFIAAGKKLHAKFPKSYIWNLGPQTTGSLPDEIMSGNGARFSNEKGEYIVASDPGVRAMLQDLKKIYASGVCAPINEWSPEWSKAFSDGTIASSLGAKWLADFIPDYAGPGQAGKWAMTAWPSIGGAAGGSESGGALHVILDKAPNKAAAIEIETKMWLTKKSFDEMRKTKTFGTMAPILKDAAASPEVRSIPYFAPGAFDAYQAALKKLKLFGYSPKYGQELDILMPYVDKYLNGALSLDEALGKLEADLKGQLGNALQQ